MKRASTTPLCRSQNGLPHCLKDIDKASAFKNQVEAPLIEKCPHSTYEFVHQFNLDSVILNMNFIDLFLVTVMKQNFVECRFKKVCWSDENSTFYISVGETLQNTQDQSDAERKAL